MNDSTLVLIVFLATAVWYTLAYKAFFDLHRYGATIKTPVGTFLWWLFSPVPPVCLVVVWYWIVRVSHGMFER